MRRRTAFNPKRKLRELPIDEGFLKNLSDKIRYGGNPEHKRNPGDFNLSPPSQPRLGKTLCDGVGIFQKAIAEALLKEGVRKGLVSAQQRNGLPQNIWAVTTEGQPLEAMLEDSERGLYHGYPMPVHDPLAEFILKRWRE